MKILSTTIIIILAIIAIIMALVLPKKEQCSVIDANTGSDIANSDNPQIRQRQILIPENYNFIWMSVETGIFNGLKLDTGTIIISEIDIYLEYELADSLTGYDKFHAIAVGNCSIEDILDHPSFGFDDKNRAIIFDADGNISELER